MTFGRRFSAAPVALALGLVVGAATLARAQGTISGRVTAQGGTPLAEARILLLGTALSIVSGEDGRYTLRNVPAGSAQLQVLHVGYKSEKQTVTVTNGATTTADVTMQVAVTQLEEVVTTATGQQRRVEIGNAVSTLGDVAAKVEQMPINSVGTLLTAKASGVQVLPATMTGLCLETLS